MKLRLPSRVLSLILSSFLSSRAQAPPPNPEAESIRAKM